MRNDIILMTANLKTGKLVDIPNEARVEWALAHDKTLALISCKPDGRQAFKLALVTYPNGLMKITDLAAWVDYAAAGAAFHAMVKLARLTELMSGDETAAALGVMR